MSVLQVVGTVVGAVAGAYLGGPMGALQGAAIGGSIGGAVNSVVNPATVTVTGPRVADLSMQVSSYGKPIPKLYGTMRIAGNVIWMQPIKESTNVTSSGGGKGGGGVKQETTTYSYSVTLAIAICEGQIDEIRNVWADSELLTNAQIGTPGANYNIYLGNETQTPDSIMESFDGVGNVPAYRGVAYVVIKDFPLENYGNRVPNFTFEVKRTVRNSPALEDKITGVTLIPGAGEFVYDTVVQKQVNILTRVAKPPNNMHNASGNADILNALDQLKSTLPNVQWVGLVVTWFATSTDAGSCDIIPKVEIHGAFTTVPDAWNVAGITRSGAQVVLYFPDGTPTYGGTPSDSTIIHLVQELKSRGYSVMFYPMVFVDTITPQPKPWRGRITPANATDAANWFTKTNGYNNFITHYLNLSVGGVALKDHIDAFIIGSEYVGMTSATFATGVYPGVTGFVNLAATAKSILPPTVKVIYTADWSEYHHAPGGWFNMDPLWSSPNIDVIGIDAYFPLTPDLPQSNITYQQIYDGWTKDEGYDYFYDNRPNGAPGTSNLVSNPFTTINGSNIVALDLTGFFNAHLLVGQAITLAGCTGSPGGISAANINGVRIIHSVIDGTHITFTAGANATSAASGGGSVCTIDKPKYFNGYTYAWKNISYFWSHTHTNPDSSSTGWTAKMKPIWFAEFGFPSVDGCSNQPNVFVDPSSSESSYPRGSQHRIDFLAQRTALEATIDFLTAQNAITGNSNLIPQQFVWTCDARPYPEYPNLTDVWADGRLWITGHWISGKLGLSNLGAIIGSLLSGIGVPSYDTSTLTDPVFGYVVKDIINVRDPISELRSIYLFDMIESDGTLKFIKRGQNSVVTIPQDNIVPTSGSGNIRTAVKMTRTQELDLPALYSISYYNQTKEYETNTQIAQRQTTKAINQVNLSVNLSLADQDAQNIVNKLLYTSWMERTSYQFTLPPQYAYLEPADIITITINNVDRVLRITDTSMQQNGAQDIKAAVEDISTYDFYKVPGNGGSTQKLPTGVPATQTDLMDLPAFPHDAPTDAFFTVATAPLAPNWSGAVLYRSDDGGQAGGNTYNLVMPITTKSTIGVTLSTLATGNTYTWDYANTVDIAMVYGTLSSTTELALLNSSNTAVIGTEIIQFLNATLIADGQYRLSGLLRGRLGTEDQIATHITGENFVLLDTTVTRLPMSLSRIGLLSYYKGVSVGDTLGNTAEQNLTYTARQLKPYSPVQITGTRDGSGNLTINWIRRTRIGGDLRDGVDVPLNEQSESYQVDVMNGSTVVRTLTATSPTVSYSAVNQATDFGSVQSSVNAKVYQISATVGRGIAGVATI